MAQRDKLPYQIHGIISSDSDSDTDTKEEFDELYYSWKPPPIDYETIKDKIVKISAKTPNTFNVWEHRRKQLTSSQQRDEQIEQHDNEEKKEEPEIKHVPVNGDLNNVNGKTNDAVVDEDENCHREWNIVTSKKTKQINKHLEKAVLEKAFLSLQNGGWDYERLSQNIDSYLNKNVNKTGRTDSKSETLCDNLFYESGRDFVTENASQNYPPHDSKIKDIESIIVNSNFGMIKHCSKKKVKVRKNKRNINLSDEKQNESDTDLITENIPQNHPGHSSSIEDGESFIVKPKVLNSENDKLSEAVVDKGKNCQGEWNMVSSKKKRGKNEYAVIKDAPLGNTLVCLMENEKLSQNIRSYQAKNISKTETIDSKNDTQCDNLFFESDVDSMTENASQNNPTYSGSIEDIESLFVNSNFGTIKHSSKNRTKLKVKKNNNYINPCHEKPNQANPNSLDSFPKLRVHNEEKVKEIFGIDKNKFATITANIKQQTSDVSTSSKTQDKCVENETYKGHGIMQNEKYSFLKYSEYVPDFFYLEQKNRACSKQEDPKKEDITHKNWSGLFVPIKEDKQDSVSAIESAVGTYSSSIEDIESLIINSNFGTIKPNKNRTKIKVKKNNRNINPSDENPNQASPNSLDSFPKLRVHNEEKVKDIFATDENKFATMTANLKQQTSGVSTSSKTQDKCVENEMYKGLGIMQNKYSLYVPNIFYLEQKNMACTKQENPKKEDKTRINWLGVSAPIRENISKDKQNSVSAIESAVISNNFGTIKPKKFQKKGIFKNDSTVKHDSHVLDYMELNSNACNCYSTQGDSYHDQGINKDVTVERKSKKSTDIDVRKKSDDLKKQRQHVSSGMTEVSKSKFVGKKKLLKQSITNVKPFEPIKKINCDIINSKRPHESEIYKNQLLTQLNLKGELGRFYDFEEIRIKKLERIQNFKKFEFLSLSSSVRSKKRKKMNSRVYSAQTRPCLLNVLNSIHFKHTNLQLEVNSYRKVYSFNHKNNNITNSVFFKKVHLKLIFVAICVVNILINQLFVIDNLIYICLTLIVYLYF